MYDQYSVLMSVYRKENPEFFRIAIESMLKQTIPTNDFVLVCDGPLTPKLDQVIQTLSDQYQDIFQIIRLETNCGLGNALNTGLKICKNELVARMDSDDISLLNRCELQLKAFQSDPELSLCGGNIMEFTPKTPRFHIAKTGTLCLPHRLNKKYFRILSFLTIA